MKDVIFAVSSGAPPAAIAVLRLSGAGALDAVKAVCGDVPPARRAVVRRLTDPATGELLDRALVLTFPGPNSATGEDLAELHLHGGRAVVRAVESCLAALPGLRPAEAGEFTRRALTNGRIDLSEAEGLGDLLSAETESQRRAAIRSAEGAVRRAVEEWTNRALTLSAHIEAMLDYGDEGDVDDSDAALVPIQRGAAVLAADIRALAERPPVERLRDGLRVVLAGPPNAGKSTLLNAMIGREAAIVSDVAGTTRDRIEAPVVRGGTAYILTDTAGLTDTPGDAIEAIGISRAQEALDSADIILWLADEAPPEYSNLIWVHSRADVEGRLPPNDAQVVVSAATGTGVEALWNRIEIIASSLLPPADLVALNARQRSLSLLAASAMEAASRQPDMILIAEEFRAALRAFDAITGRAGVEAMLDALFGRFCIGK